MLRPIKELTSVGIDEYYLSYFSRGTAPLEVIGFLPSNGSKDRAYYLAPCEIGRVAVISVGDLTQPKHTDAGGEYRLSLKKAIEKPDNSNRFYKDKKVDLAKAKHLLDTFNYLVMITGCDDGHIAFYFRSKKQALEYLELADTFEELEQLSTGINEALTLACLDDIEFLEDYKN